MNLAAFAEQHRPLVQQALARQLQSFSSGPLRDACSHLLGRGKLFRPLLVLATARAVSGQAVIHLAALAAAVEFIHTFTLIHDDLPCMDDAGLRRGVPSVHLAYDEATAVLAGDALQAWGVYLLAVEPPELPPATRLALVRETAHAVKLVIEGQILDLAGEGRELSLAELTELHSKKTGALLGACCASGALLAGADDQVVSELRDWGMQIGLAFQIRDDLLSLQSTPAVMGKSLETDIAKQKATYPSVLGIEAAEEQLHALQISIAMQLDRVALVQPDVLRELAAAAGERES